MDRASASVQQQPKACAGHWAGYIICTYCYIAMYICGFTCMLQWVPMCRIGKFHKVLINSKLAAYKPHSNTWIQLEKFVEITQIEPMGLQMVKIA